MIRSTLIYIINSPVLFFGVLFLFRLCLWGVMENLWRARPVRYRQVAAKDFAAETFIQFVVFPSAIYLSYYLMNLVYRPFPQIIEYHLNLPMILRLGIYFTLGDFCFYWAHRLMHTNIFLWRVHKWHHVPTYMYWLAGNRATIQHAFLLMTCFIVWAPILYRAQWWVYTALGIYSVLHNDWVHLNLRWRSRWLEWFIVMPRWHHIHHSSNPDHSCVNLGLAFTFWDRLFGTYVDPDTLERKEIAFGIGEKVSPVRLIAGL
jgi:sterol desaturase/sphingolipid hydroxylase (fatty acid hydroxylase superfamily)